jgi:DNA-binding CsgD family transcriptional regulator
VGPEAFASLPAVQQEALDAALLRGGRQDSHPCPRAIATAATSLLRAVAQEHSVLVAIDDLHWLDRASADALVFALRRLPRGSVRVLATLRTPSALAPADRQGAERLEALQAALPPGSVAALGVRPCSPELLGAIIEQRLGRTLPGRVLRQLHEHTGGNPFWAIEAVRAAGDADPAAPLPLPDSLAGTVAARLRALPEDVREVLASATALSHPPTGLVARALAGRTPDPAAAIDAAVSAGVVEETGGRLRPAHPVLGSVALQLLLPSQRSGLHRRLADAVTDPEQRARHLAIAAEGTQSAELAADLDAGAAIAQGRGAIESAADLAERAIAATPRTDPAARAVRQLRAAEISYVAGRPETAAELAAQAAAGGEAAERVAALCLLGQITYYRDGSGTARDHLQRALAEAGDDPRLRARALTALAEMADLGARRDLQHAEEALALLAEAGDPPEHDVRRAALLASVGAQLDLAMGLDEQRLREAAACEQAQLAAGRQPPGSERVAFQTSWWFKVVDQLDRSRAAIHQAIEVAAHGAVESELPNLYGHLALTECWAGRYADARDAVDAGARHAALTGWSPTALYGAAGLLEALTGDTGAARRTVTRDLAFGEEHGHPRAVVAQWHVLGLADLLDGDPEAAARRLGAAYDLARANDILEPARRHRLEPDLGQAWLAVGRVDEAAALAHEQRELGERMGRPGLLAVGLRLEGLVHAARGDLEGAVELVQRALTAAEASPFPLEVGRTHLALGQVLRRARAKQRARDSLATARAVFARLGSPPWEAMAAAELQRVAGTHAGAALTATEQRVAQLVASGHTNREVAAELFTSVRTVEGHLAAVYRKLGLRGRVALAHHLNSTLTSSTPARTST